MNDTCRCGKKECTHERDMTIKIICAIVMMMAFVYAFVIAKPAKANVVEVPDVLTIVETTSLYAQGGLGHVYKIYDRNNDVVCYAYARAGTGASISCLK